MKTTKVFKEKIANSTLVAVNITLCTTSWQGELDLFCAIPMAEIGRMGSEQLTKEIALAVWKKIGLGFLPERPVVLDILVLENFTFELNAGAQALIAPLRAELDCSKN